MFKHFKYVPTGIVILLLPVLIIYPIWQLVLGFTVFSVFSFFFMREFNIEDKNEVQTKLNNLEDKLVERINFLEAELKRLDVKTKDLNNAVTTVRMNKPMQR